MSAIGYLPAVPCIKQKTRCVILRSTGERYEATNTCQVSGLDRCPREAMGSKTGEDYELCGSEHAESNASKLAFETREVPGVALLFGHNWICRECQLALQAVGVRRFVIMEGEA